MTLLLIFKTFKMKLFVALLILPFACAESLDDLSPYGYISKYAIPFAEKLQKAEDAAVNNLSGRIVGGEAAKLGDYPYQAGMISDIVNMTGRGVCGGSLLSANKVLTAAHCWYDGRNQAWRFTVVLGSVYLFHGGVRIQTSDVVMHQLWFPLLARNDVAVVTLPENIAFTDYISPVSLPNLLETFENFAGEQAVASGYGLTVSGGNLHQNQSLNHVTLRVLSNDVCSSFFPIHVVDSTICTSGLGGTSTCQGDSGGPLVVRRGGRRVLIGATSFGIALGCDIGFPAAYARVTSFLGFINANL